MTARKELDKQTVRWRDVRFIALVSSTIFLFVAVPVSGFVEAMQGLQLMYGMVTTDRINNQYIEILYIREIAAITLYVIATWLIYENSSKLQSVIPLSRRLIIPVILLIGIAVIYSVVGALKSEWILVASGLRWYFYLPLFIIVMFMVGHLGRKSTERLIMGSVVGLIVVEFSIAMIQTYVMPPWTGFNAFGKTASIGTFSNQNALGSLFVVSLFAVLFVFELKASIRNVLALICLVGITLTAHLTALALAIVLVSGFLGYALYQRKAVAYLAGPMLLALFAVYSGIQTVEGQKDLVISHSLYPRISVLFEWVIGDDPTNPTPTVISVSPTNTPEPPATITPTIPVEPTTEPIATVTPTIVVEPTAEPTSAIVPTATVEPTAIAIPTESPAPTPTPVVPTPTPAAGSIDFDNGSFGWSALIGRGIGVGTNTSVTLNRRSEQNLDTRIVDSALTASMSQYGILGAMIIIGGTLSMFSLAGWRGVGLWLSMWALGSSMLVFEVYPTNVLIPILFALLFARYVRLEDATSRYASAGEQG